jgi:hypothetical protein
LSTYRIFNYESLVVEGKMESQDEAVIGFSEERIVYPYLEIGSMI